MKKKLRNAWDFVALVLVVLLLKTVSQDRKEWVQEQAAETRVKAFEKRRVEEYRFN